MRLYPTLLALGFAALPAFAANSASTSFPVTIRVDATTPGAELKPIYRFFGADQPNYAYMKDGKKLLRDIGQLGEPQEYFRAHQSSSSPATARPP